MDRPEKQYLGNETPVKRDPYISYWGLYKSSKILEYISKFYFPLYDLSLQAFINCYPILSFVEALVYEADKHLEASQTGEASFSETKPWTHRKALILDVLKAHNLDLPKVLEELDNLEKLWQLENKMVYHGIVTHEDNARAAELKASDLRALHGLFIQMTNKNFDQNIFDLMWTLEVYESIQVDIIHYKDDVADGKYNTYRMFVKLYGEEAPSYIKAELKHYHSLYQERLAKIPEDKQIKLLKIVQGVPSPSIPEPILE